VSRFEHAPDWLARRAELSPDAPAITIAADGRTLTFFELNARCNQTARWLQDRAGLGRGERVAVLAHNRLEYLEVFMACQKLGAVLQNLNWRLHPDEMAKLVHNAAPQALLFGSELSEAAQALAAQDDLPTYGFDEPGSAGRFAPRDFADTDLELEPVPLQAPWVICYTGGTTGLPKGALLTQGNILSNAINTVVSWGLSANDVAILNAPLFHTGGLNVFTAPLLYVGGHSVLYQGFEPEQVFDAVEQGATLCFGVPTMFQMLQAHPRWPEADFKHMKLVISGGAPCPAPVFEAFFKKQVSFTTGYGLTEAGPNNFWLPKARAQAKAGAVGRPLMHVQVKLLADDGELCIKGPHVIPGYFNNPKATAEAIDEEGWLHTGDLARRDEDGDYWICGRKKDLIISGGENIYPAEVEDALLSHEHVLQAAVIGAPDDRWGEVPVAFIVAQAELTDQALLSHARDRLARYKVPKALYFVKTMPMTGPGKVDKRRLSADLKSRS